MAMATSSFRFKRAMRGSDVRVALRGEVGARASERNIDIMTRDVEGDAAYRTREPHTIVMLESMDGVAMVYAEKVCEALGGVPERPRTRPLPGWTATPWVKLSWWRRFRLLVGPTDF